MFKRAVAALTVCAFTALTFSPVKLAASVSQAVSLEKYQPLDFSQLHIPEKIGNIQEIYQPTEEKTKSPVILIQDAHAIPEAQRNIQKLVTFFQKKYGIKTVALEGAASELDAQMLRSFPDKKKLRLVLESYAKEAEITGGVLAAILNFTESEYLGIEDWDLYQEGIYDYLTAMKQEKLLQSQWDAASTVLDAEKTKWYSKELLIADQIIKSFETHQKTFAETLQNLAAFKRPEPGSDLATLLNTLEISKKEEPALKSEALKLFESLMKRRDMKLTGAEIKKVNAGKQDLDLSRISAAQFWAETQKILLHHESSIKASENLQKAASFFRRLEAIQAGTIFDEFRDYAEQVRESLFQNEGQRNLGKRSRELELKQKLIRLELSRKEWNEYRLRTASENFYRLTLQDHEAFYKNAQERDAAFLKNLEIHWRKKSKEKKGFGTILIAGGFHTQGMMRRLKEKGISYAVISPAITELPKETNYRKHMSGDVSWKNYFKEQKGKVSLYEAFIRGVRDRLLSPDSSALAKMWRDKIILDLAAQNRLADVGKYTGFLDELGRPQTADFRQKYPAAERVKKFTNGLLKLEVANQFTKENILQLFQNVKATTPSLVNSPAVLSPGKEGRIYPYLLKGGQTFPSRAEIREFSQEDRRKAFSAFARAYNEILPIGQKMREEQIIENFLSGRDAPQITLKKRIEERRYDVQAAMDYLEALSFGELLRNRLVFGAVWQVLEETPAQRVRFCEKVLEKVFSESLAEETFDVSQSISSVKIGSKKQFRTFPGRVVFFPEDIGAKASLKTKDGAKTIAIYPPASMAGDIPNVTNNHLLYAVAFITFYEKEIAGKKTILVSHIQSDLAHTLMENKDFKKQFRDWRWMIRAALEFYAKRHGVEVILSPTAELMQKRWPGMSPSLADLVYDVEMTGHGYSLYELSAEPEWESGLSSPKWWRQEMTDSAEDLTVLQRLFVPLSEDRLINDSSILLDVQGIEASQDILDRAANYVSERFGGSKKEGYEIFKKLSYVPPGTNLDVYFVQANEATPMLLLVIDNSRKVLVAGGRGVLWDKGGIVRYQSADAATFEPEQSWFRKTVKLLLKAKAINIWISSREDLRSDDAERLYEALKRDDELHVEEIQDEFWVMLRSESRPQKKRIISELANELTGLPQKFPVTYLQIPHYNVEWHQEGGVTGELQDHLQLVMTRWESFMRGEYSLAPKYQPLAELIREISQKYPDDLEAAVMTHDLGKARKRYQTLRQDGVSHGFRGHEEGSYRLLRGPGVQYKKRAISNKVIFAARYHGLHYQFTGSSLSWQIKIAELKKKYGESETEFYEALKFLIAFSALDQIGALPQNAEQGDLESVLNFYAEFLKFQNTLKQDEIRMIEYSYHHDMQRQGVVGHEYRPIWLFGEQEVLSPFLSTSSSSVPSIPTMFYKGKNVLVVPGYGNLPFLLAALGAREVTALDVDPHTIAWQKLKWKLGRTALAGMLTSVNESSGMLLQNHYRRSMFNLRKDPQAEDVYPWMSFQTGDILLPETFLGKKYDLVVIPYLFGFPFGLTEEKEWNLGLRNLKQALNPDGRIIFLPGEVSVEDIPNSSVNKPMVERFNRWIHDLDSSTWDISHSPRYDFYSLRAGSVKASFSTLTLRTARSESRETPSQVESGLSSSESTKMLFANWTKTLRESSVINERSDALDKILKYWDFLPTEERDSVAFYVLSDPNAQMRQKAISAVLRVNHLDHRIQEFIKNPVIYSGNGSDQRLATGQTHQPQISRHLARAAALFVLFTKADAGEMQAILKKELKEWRAEEEELRLRTLYQSLPLGDRSGIKEAPLGVDQPLSLLDCLRLYQMWREKKWETVPRGVFSPELQTAINMTPYVGEQIDLWFPKEILEPGDDDEAGELMNPEMHEIEVAAAKIIYGVTERSESREIPQDLLRQVEKMTYSRHQFFELVHILNRYWWLIQEEGASGPHDKQELGFVKKDGGDWQFNPRPFFEWDEKRFETLKGYVEELMTDRIMAGYWENEALWKSGDGQRLLDLSLSLGLAIPFPQNREAQPVVNDEVDLYSPALYSFDLLAQIHRQTKKYHRIEFLKSEIIDRWLRITPNDTRVGIFFSKERWQEFLRDVGIATWAGGYAHSNVNGNFMFFDARSFDFGVMVHELVHILQQNVRKISRPLFEEVRGFIPHENPMRKDLEDWAAAALHQGYGPSELGAELAAYLYQAFLGFEVRSLGFDSESPLWSAIQHFVRKISGQKESSVAAQVLSHMRNYYLWLSPMIPLPAVFRRISGVDDAFVFPESNWPEQSESFNAGKKRGESIAERAFLTPAALQALRRKLGRMESFEWKYKEGGIHERTLGRSKDFLRSFLETFETVILESGIVGQWSLAFHASNQDGRGDILTFLMDEFRGDAVFAPLVAELQTLQQETPADADLPARMKRDLTAMGLMSGLQVYFKKQDQEESVQKFLVHMKEETTLDLKTEALSRFTALSRFARVKSRPDLLASFKAHTEEMTLRDRPLVRRLANDYSILTARELVEPESLIRAEAVMRQLARIVLAGAAQSDAVKAQALYYLRTLFAEPKRADFLEAENFVIPLLYINRTLEDVRPIGSEAVAADKAELRRQIFDTAYQRGNAIPEFVKDAFRQLIPRELLDQIGYPSNQKLAVLGADDKENETEWAIYLKPLGHQHFRIDLAHSWAEVEKNEANPFDEHVFLADIGLRIREDGTIVIETPGRIAPFRDAVANYPEIASAAERSFVFWIEHSLIPFANGLDIPLIEINQSYISDIALVASKFQKNEPVNALKIWTRKEGLHARHESRHGSENQIQKIVRERDLNSKLAFKYLNNLPSGPKVNIYVARQSYNGVYGGAYLLAREIRYKIPKSQVRMLLIDGDLPSAFRGFTPGIEVVQDFKPHLEQATMKDSDFNFFISGGTRHFPPLPSQPNVITGGQFRSDYDLSWNPQKAGMLDIHMNFLRPNSTVQLVTENRDRVLEKDHMSFQQLARAKEQWHEEFAQDRNGFWPMERLRNLQEFAEKNGWKIENAVMSWMYFKDMSFVEDELAGLAAAVESGAFDRQSIWAPQGRQILFHTVLPQYLEDAFLTTIQKMGFSTMDAEGRIYQGKYPITIVLHHKIPYQRLQDLQILSGTMARYTDSKDQGRWVGFPAYVTGWGSLLEAASSGQPWIHDRFDAGIQQFSKPFTALVENILGLYGGRPGKPSAVTEMTTAEVAGEFFMGNPRKAAIYNDLLGWSEFSRWFSDSLFQMNMVDDFAIELAKHKGLALERAEAREAKSADEIAVQPMLRVREGKFTSLVADMRELLELYPHSPARSELESAILKYASVAAKDAITQSMIDFEHGEQAMRDAREALARFYEQTVLAEMTLPAEVKVYARTFDPLDLSRIYINSDWAQKTKDEKLAYHLSQNRYRVRINGQDYVFGKGTYLEFEYPDGTSDFLYDYHNLFYAFAALKAPSIKQKRYVLYDEHADSGEADPIDYEAENPFEMAQLYHIENFHAGVLKDLLRKEDGWRWKWLSHPWREPDKEEAALYDETGDFTVDESPETGGIAGVDLDMISRGVGSLLTHANIMKLYQQDRDRLIRQLPGFETRAFFISDEYYLKPAAGIRIFADLYSAISVVKQKAPLVNALPKGEEDSTGNTITEDKQKVLDEAKNWESRIFLDGQLRKEVSTEELEKARIFYDQINPLEWRGQELAVYRKRFHQALKLIIKEQMNRARIRPEHIALIAHQLNNFLNGMLLLNVRTENLPGHVHAESEALYDYLVRRVETATQVMASMKQKTKTEEIQELTQKVTQLLMDINRLSTGWKFLAYVKELQSITSPAALQKKAQKAADGLMQSSSVAAEFSRSWLGIEQPKITDVDLDIAFTRALKAHSDLNSVAEIRLDLQQRYSLSTYEVYLMEALLNFLKNAAESLPAPSERTRRRGDVSINARWLESGALEVAIEDRGLGIRPENLAAIRTHRAFTTKSEGHGIGMIRSMELVEGPLQGTFEIESVVGTGTKIKLTFPPTLAQELPIIDLLGEQGYRGPSVSTSEVFVGEYANTKVGIISEKEVEVSAASSVLLVGNSPDEIAVFLKKYPKAKISIVDQSFSQMQRIRERFSASPDASRIRLFHADAAQLSPEYFKDQFFNLIVLSGVDETAYDDQQKGKKHLKKIAQEMVRILAPGGVLFHSLLNMNDFYGEIPGMDVIQYGMLQKHVSRSENRADYTDPIYHQYPKLIDLKLNWFEFLSLSPADALAFRNASEGGQYAQSSFEWLEALKEDFSLTPDKKILDVGSGNGIAAIAFHVITGAEVTSIEMDPERWQVLNHFLEFLKEKKGMEFPKVHFKKADFLEFPLEGYDFIYFYFTSPEKYTHLHGNKIAAYLESHLPKNSVFVSPNFLLNTESPGKEIDRFAYFDRTSLQYRAYELPQVSFYSGHSVVLERRSELRNGERKKPSESKDNSLMTVLQAIQKRDLAHALIRKSELLKDLPHMNEEIMGRRLKVLEDLGIIAVDRQGLARDGYPIRWLLENEGINIQELEFVLSEYATIDDLAVMKPQVEKLMKRKRLFSQLIPEIGKIDYKPELDRVRVSNSRATNSVLRITYENVEKYFGHEWVKATSFFALTSGVDAAGLPRILRELETIGLLEVKRFEHPRQSPWIRMVKMSKEQKAKVHSILLSAEKEINLKQASVEIAEVLREPVSGQVATRDWGVTKPGRESVFPRAVEPQSMRSVGLNLESLMTAIWAIEKAGGKPTFAGLREKFPKMRKSATIRNFANGIGVDLRGLGVRSFQMSPEKKKFEASLQNAVARLRYGNPEYQHMPLLQADLEGALHIQLKKIMEGVRRHKIDLEALGVFPSVYNSSAQLPRFSDLRKEWAQIYLRSLHLPDTDIYVDFVMGVPDAWKKVNTSDRARIEAVRSEWERTRAERYENWRNDYLRQTVRHAQEAYQTALKEEQGGDRLRQLRIKLKQIAPGDQLLALNSARNQQRLRAVSREKERNPKADEVRHRGTPEEISRIISEARIFLQSHQRDLDARIKILKSDGVLTLIGGIYNADERKFTSIEQQIRQLLLGFVDAPYAWKISGHDFYVWSENQAPPFKSGESRVVKASRGPFRDSFTRRRSELRSLALATVDYLFDERPSISALSLSKRISQIEEGGISFQIFLRMIGIEGERREFQKDQALMRTALAWMNQVLNQEGAVSAAFDLPESEKMSVEAVLASIKGRDRFVALLAQGMGEVASGGIVTQRVKEFARYRPLHSIRGIQIQNADRVARIRLPGVQASDVSPTLSNPNLFYISARGAVRDFEPILQRVLELVADIMIGTVTSREIHSTRELQTSPEDIEQRVLAALLKGSYEGFIPQGKGLIHINPDGTVQVDIPIFSSLIEEMNARLEMQQSA